MFVFSFSVRPARECKVEDKVNDNIDRSIHKHQLDGLKFLNRLNL